MTAKEIRESFKKFFESKEHLIVPSAPMVVKDDPTLMFTNAGMNQFKDIILGNATPKCRRQADSQKCLRVSGKHNDLEEVGHDTYHHTMFEMLGNWSFGDYFKKEAISWAWEYIVDVLKIDPKDLYATVFEGSPEEGLSRDDEAAGIWEQFLPKDHIINGSRHDNFWEMGDTGPCGPCSEIHVDSRPEEEKAKVPGRELVNKDHPQVIEIWNLVFMQYNRKADGSLEGLPAKVIDTGMGFERLVRTLQGKTSNYDTDVFQPLIKVLGDMAGCRYGEDEKTDIAMRVVVDHLRAIAFAIADGQLPSNAKAGYVIRRILRRAVRYGYTFLGQKEAFIYKLVPALVDEMGDAFPEIAAQQKLVMKVMQEEESSFLRTLENGIKLLQGVIDETKAAGKTEIAGDKAFTLFDTFGFPLDLTELICREQGLTVDEKGFDVCMQEQKNRARNAAEVKLGDWISPLPTSPKGEESFTSPSLPTSPKGEESHAACSSTENLTANNPDGNHSPLGETVGASKEELKALHTLIKKETADIEAFSYNTTIAAFMVCLNELTKLKSESREVKESLAILLAPFCPHLAEEFWHLLGHDTSVCDAPWPAFNEDYLKEDSVKMMVAFNGKARFPLEFPADVTKEEAEKAALADPQSAKWMEGFTVAKVIVVPGKMINVVLKK